MTETHAQQVQLGPQGRLVIPVELRRAMGLEVGEPLVVRIENGRLVIEKREAILARIQALTAHIPKERMLSEELIAERRAEAQREADELAAQE